MKDEMKEEISAFIDNENYSPAIIEQAARDPEIRAKMTRYSLISDVLNNRYADGSHQLASKVHAALDQEATLIVPKTWLKTPKIMKQVAGLAVAATVAAVAILVVGDFSPTKVTDTTVAVGPITDKPLRVTSEVQQKLNGYLVSHTEFSASSRMKGMLPYTRIASFPAGQPVDSPATVLQAEE
ncbi:MAG: sigma-E factor negative regulatory protein [Thioalkalispiraceae bacterium]